MDFEALITEAYLQTRSLLCVGLDLADHLIPPGYSKEEYLEKIIESTKNHAIAYKPNLSCYIEDIELLKKACRMAHEYGRVVIIDSKVNDVGHTAFYYAIDYLEKIGADACTVNPLPFLDDMIGASRPYLEKGKGIFVLLYTTSPHSQMFWENCYIKGLPLWKFIALKVACDWSQGLVGAYYSRVGIVAAPRREELAKEIREICDTQIILAPGFGVQGVSLTILKYLKKKDAPFPGIIGNVGRSIIAKWKDYPGEDPIKIVEREAEKWKKDMIEALK